MTHGDAKNKTLTHLQLVACSRACFVLRDGAPTPGCSGGPSRRDPRFAHGTSPSVCPHATHGMSPSVPARPTACSPSVCPCAAATLQPREPSTSARTTVTWPLHFDPARLLHLRVASSCVSTCPAFLSCTSDLRSAYSTHTFERSHNSINPVKHSVLMTVSADNLLGSREGTQVREAQTLPLPCLLPRCRVRARVFVLSSLSHSQGH